MQFQNRSGLMRLTDPQYPRGTWCTAVLPVQPGEWAVSHQTEDGRVSSLRVEHISCNREPDELIPLVFGVDSGQFGFYDDAHYPAHPSEFEYDNIRGFYRRVCDRFGNVDIIKNETGDAFGVTSSSGYGDGVYSVYGVSRDGVYLAFEVRFIEPIADYDDEGWEEEARETDEREFEDTECVTRA